LKREEEFAVSFGYHGGKKELVVKTGSTVKLELDTNPSTGYGWEFVNEKEIKNSAAIELTEDTYKSSCSNDGPVMVSGCGGIRTLRYRIKDATKALPKIDLVYKRSWEEEVIGEVIVTLKSGEKVSTKTTKSEVFTVQTTVASKSDKPNPAPTTTTTTTTTATTETTDESNPTTTVESDEHSSSSSSSSFPFSSTKHFFITGILTLFLSILLLKKINKPKKKKK